MTPAETLQAHGVAVVDARVPGRPYTWAPEGIMVHWTASYPSTSTPVPALNVVQNGRRGVPGPLYHWLVGRDGGWRWICDGYANHAGGGNSTVLDLMARGEGPVATARTLGLADTGGGGNRRSVGVSLENSGSEPVEGHVLDSFIRGLAALCTHYGWGARHVISHASYTARKVDWPTQDMVRFRQLLEGYHVSAGPHGPQEPRFNPPVRIDARWRDWCVIDNGDGTHGLIALGESGDIYAFGTAYLGAPNNEILGRTYEVIGDPVRVRPIPGGYEVITSTGHPYGYTA